MERTFERYRDSKNTIRRSYSGAFNNRIDRFPDTGGAFRVEGVTNHTLKTDCFITEDVVIRRTQPGPNDVEITAANARYFRNLYSFYNRALYAHPRFPSLPDRESFERCVEPLYQVPDLASFMTIDRFALNKTFDNVRWRTENAKNSFQCNIFDTVELVPWLSHNDCLTDIARKPAINFQTTDITWFDFETNSELPTAPAFSNIQVPFVLRGYLGITHIRIDADADGDYLVDNEFDITNNVESHNMKLFRHDTAHLAKEITITFDTETKGYSNVELQLQTDFANHADPFTANEPFDLFTEGEAASVPYTYTDAGVRAAIAAPVRLGIVADALRTSPVQSDGYCYFPYHPNQEAEVIDANSAPDPFVTPIPLVVFDGANRRKTNLVLMMPSFRVALGASRIDFQR